MRYAVALYELVRRRAPGLHRLIRGALRLAVRALSVVMRFRLPQEQQNGYRFLIGQHEPGTTHLLKHRVHRGAVVVDVGAHIGYFTRILAKRVGEHGTVYAFEPNPDIFALLRHNTSRMRNVRAIMAAVLDSEAEVTLYHGASSMMASLWTANTRGEPVGFTARGTRLDEVLEGSRPDLVKIDVEGAEPEVLDGMRHLIDDGSPDLTVLVECNPTALQGRGASARALYSQLKELRLDVCGVDESARELVELPTDADLERMLGQGRKYVNLWCTRPTPP